jgi:hypothetical protein
MKLECFLPSLAFPQTSHTFNLFSSGATSTTFVAFALMTLPLSPLDEATATVITCRNEGTVCTAIELAIPFHELEPVDMF